MKKMISGVVYAFIEIDSSTARFSFDTDSGTHVVEMRSAFVSRMKEYMKANGHLAAFWVNERLDSFELCEALLGDSGQRETIYGTMKFVDCE